MWPSRKWSYVGTPDEEFGGSVSNLMRATGWSHVMSSRLCWRNAWSCRRSWMWLQRPKWHGWVGAPYLCKICTRINPKNWHECHAGNHQSITKISVSFMDVIYIQLFILQRVWKNSLSKPVVWLCLTVCSHMDCRECSSRNRNNTGPILEHLSQVQPIFRLAPRPANISRITIFACVC